MPKNNETPRYNLIVFLIFVNIFCLKYIYYQGLNWRIGRILSRGNLQKKETRFLD